MPVGVFMFRDTGCQLDICGCGVFSGQPDMVEIHWVIFYINLYISDLYLTYEYI